MQSSNHILLIKPAIFMYNPETAQSNAFQATDGKHSARENAIPELERMAEQLIAKGVDVTVIEDTQQPIKPDALFPNNWVTFHSSGTVVLYPMLAKNRRAERRHEILERIGTRFEIKEVIDLSFYEQNNRFLEGTGSIVFDHTNRIAYACLSPRTDKGLLIRTCEILGYRPIYFYSLDIQGEEVFHTNVMMNIGNGFSVICLESIRNHIERKRVVHSLTNSGHRIIDISYRQMHSFCGNLVELGTKGKKNILAMSKRAHDNLSTAQKNILERYCELCPLQVDTIEKIGGGSVRCMIAEIFLPKKTITSPNTPRAL